MNLELKHQEEKPYFDRGEYVLTITDTNTPSYPVMKAEIAKKLNAKEELVIIKRVKHQFGKKEIVVNVYVYNSAESMKKYEDIKEEKKEEKPAEASK